MKEYPREIEVWKMIDFTHYQMLKNKYDREKRPMEELKKAQEIREKRKELFGKI